LEEKAINVIESGNAPMLGKVKGLPKLPFWPDRLVASFT